MIDRGSFIIGEFNLDVEIGTHRLSLVAWPNPRSDRQIIWHGVWSDNVSCMEGHLSHLGNCVLHAFEFECFEFSLKWLLVFGINAFLLDDVGLEVFEVGVKNVVQLQDDLLIDVGECWNGSNVGVLWIFEWWRFLQLFLYNFPHLGILSWYCPVIGGVVVGKRLRLEINSEFGGLSGAINLISLFLVNLATRIYLNKF